MVSIWILRSISVKNFDSTGSQVSYLARIELLYYPLTFHEVIVFAFTTAFQTRITAQRATTARHSNVFTRQVQGTVGHFTLMVAMSEALDWTYVPITQVKSVISVLQRQ